MSCRSARSRRWALMSLAGGALIAGAGRAPGSRARAKVRASPHAEIRTLLATVAEAFDRRDLARFVALYSDDPETTYVFAGRVVVGKAAIIDEYRATFFDAASAQDRLTLDLVRLRRAGAFLLATVRARVAGGDGRTKFEGVSSLVLRREREGWRAIYDHAG